MLASGMQPSDRSVGRYFTTKNEKVCNRRRGVADGSVERRRRAIIVKRRGLWRFVLSAVEARNAAREMTRNRGLVNALRVQRECPVGGATRRTRRAKRPAVTHAGRFNHREPGRHSRPSQKGGEERSLSPFVPYLTAFGGLLLDACPTFALRLRQVAARARRAFFARLVSRLYLLPCRFFC